MRSCLYFLPNAGAIVDRFRSFYTIPYVVIPIPQRGTRDLFFGTTPSHEGGDTSESRAREAIPRSPMRKRAVWSPMRQRGA